MIASGCLYWWREEIRSIAGFCANKPVFGIKNQVKKKIIYTTMLFILYAYASNISLQRYIKILIPCNT